ncbi:MAG: hypothetical protein ACREBV_05805, partial [Candidatus Zixiibacteriota bacterium]
PALHEGKGKWMQGSRYFFTICFLFGMGNSVKADVPTDLSINISVIDVAKLGWGRHTFPVKVVNHGEYLKYMAVSTNVRCKGVRLSPERNVSRFFSIYPDDSAVTQGVLQVPANYGEISYEVKLYDVVDTLDILLESQVINSQTGSVSFPAPKSISPYLNLNVSLPPMVGKHIDFDNDFSLILPYLITEGKSVAEIARMAGCDTTFVINELAYMVSRGYYQKDANGYLTAIAAINEAESAKEAELATKVAESVSAQLAVNFKSYNAVLDSLVKGEFLTKDSNSFMDGGAILYRPFPVVTTLSLWYDLGGSFITGGAQPLYLFDGSDLCNAYLPFYMYMAAGPKENNGYQLFAFMRNFRSYQFYYSDTLPNIICPEDFMFSPQVGMPVGWEYGQGYFPEGFMVDTNQVRPMLNHFRTGMGPILKDASTKLEALARKYKRTSVLLGQRYWFWNIVATRTIENLKSKGILARRGTGVYRLDGMSSK